MPSRRLEPVLMLSSSQTTVRVASTPCRQPLTVTGKLWEILDIIALIEAKDAGKPMVRASYKKKL
jgi:hypothetical protein